MKKLLMRNLFLSLFCILFIAAHTDPKPELKKKKIYKIEKSAISNKAMVVSAHPLASKIGMDIIKAGGNAVDAAIAVHYALSVVYPLAGNIGGGGFMLIRMNNGETAALDFREKAPAQANRDMYLDKNGNPIPNLNQYGHLAPGVPGSVDGLFKAFEKYSKLKNFQRLILPAIDIAEQGFAITFGEAFHLNNHQSNFRKYNTKMPVFVKNGGWKTGDTLRQKDLAYTLNLICEKGEKGFYEGEIAKKIVAEMNRGGGIISLQDLKNYDAVWRKPLKGKYKDYEIIGMPPPSAGGVALLQMLKIVADFPLQAWGFHSKNAVHLMVEAERRAYADRAKHLGDPDFWKVPLTALLDEKYLERQRQSINMNVATPSAAVQPGKFAVASGSEETTHFSIVDTEGNAVACTTTLNGTYGSHVVVPGAGFILNNEMDDFCVKPGIADMYGAISGEANAIQPNKRMLSSMTPTILTKNGQLFMLVGSPGGTTIPTSVFQTILNVIEWDMSAANAVRAKRFHSQWYPDQIYVEARTFLPEQRKALEMMGHKFKEREPIGRVEAIVRRANGILEGGADVRGDDHAEAW